MPASPPTTERLRRLDAMFGSALPSGREGPDPRIAVLEAAHARRGWVDDLDAPPTTLPWSVVQRARLIAELGAARVFLPRDVDGLGLVLASAEVFASEPLAAVRTWLEGERPALGARLTLLSAEAAPEQVDLAVVEVHEPARTLESLRRAVAATRPGGHLVARVRSPWEDAFFRLVGELGMTVVRYQREIDHVVIPGGFVVDGAGDLVVLERPATFAAAPADASVAARVRVQPAYWIDLDGLAPERVEAQGALAAFGAAVERRVGVSGVVRELRDEPERVVFCWYAADGRGYTAELDREQRHLLATIAPYDEALEAAVLVEAFATFADEHTRARPRRTGRTHRQSLFA